MVKYEHAYIQINYNIYKDFTLYSYLSLQGRGRKMTPTFLLCDWNLENLVWFRDLLPETKLKPKKGDSLYVVPPCKYAVADLRNTYQIKRTIDTAQFNVFSPLPRSRTSVYLKQLVVFPTNKIIVSDFGNHSEDTWRIFAEQYEQHSLLPDNPIYLSNKTFYAYDVSEAYKLLMDGGVKKPCILDKDISLSSENELTADMLRLAYEAGKNYGDEAEKNFVFQLNNINQSNWREHKGLMYLLLNEMLYFSQISSMRRSRHKYPKPIQEMLGITESKIPKEDYPILYAFLNSLLNIGQTKFATFADVDAKLSNYRIPKATFFEVFDGTVRLTPKNLDENSHSIS